MSIIKLWPTSKQCPKHGQYLKNSKHILSDGRQRSRFFHGKGNSLQVLFINFNATTYLFFLTFSRNFFCFLQCHTKVFCNCLFLYSRWRTMSDHTFESIMLNHSKTTQKVDNIKTYIFQYKRRNTNQKTRREEIRCQEVH